MSKHDSIGFGKGSLNERDWEVIAAHTHDQGVQRVLEIGAGYSTLLFTELGLDLVSYETDDKFIDALRQRVPQAQIIRYDYPDFPKEHRRFDMALVDGPGKGNYDGRKSSMLFARPLADVIFVHDSGRKKERESIRDVFPSPDWRETKYSGYMASFVQREADRDTFLITVTE